MNIRGMCGPIVIELVENNDNVHAVCISTHVGTTLLRSLSEWLLSLFMCTYACTLWYMVVFEILEQEWWEFCCCCTMLCHCHAAHCVQVCDVCCGTYVLSVGWLVVLSLTSLFSTNTAISETKCLFVYRACRRCEKCWMNQAALCYRGHCQKGFGQLQK